VVLKNCIVASYGLIFLLGAAGAFGASPDLSLTLTPVSPGYAAGATSITVPIVPGSVTGINKNYPAPRNSQYSLGFNKQWERGLYSVRLMWAALIGMRATGRSLICPHTRTCLRSRLEQARRRSTGWFPTRATLKSSRRLMAQTPITIPCKLNCMGVLLVT